MCWRSCDFPFCDFQSRTHVIHCCFLIARVHCLVFSTDHCNSLSPQPVVSCHFFSVDSSLRQEDVANADAQDQFHRAMAVRKRRSKQFFENPLCVFTMLNTLVFHHYLTRVTAAAFELHNSDKEGIPLKPSKAQEAKQRKRLLFKGAPGSGRTTRFW